MNEKRERIVFDLDNYDIYNTIIISLVVYRYILKILIKQLLIGL